MLNLPIVYRILDQISLNYFIIISNLYVKYLLSKISLSINLPFLFFLVNNLSERFNQNSNTVEANNHLEFIVNTKTNFDSTTTYGYFCLSIGECSEVGTFIMIVRFYI